MLCGKNKYKYILFIENIDEVPTTWQCVRGREQRIVGKISPLITIDGFAFFPYTYLLMPSELKEIYQFIKKINKIYAKGRKKC